MIGVDSNSAAQFPNQQNPMSVGSITVCPKSQPDTHQKSIEGALILDFYQVLLGLGPL